MKVFETIDADLASFLRDVIVLTPYGVELRYPGDRPDATLEEAHRTIELARKVRESILDALR
ncbi:HEPN domain-containing protein [Candidatus Poribacteria bacterium]|nr:HEPN domain-containing protein [Candidatus Poribacteria bacterium]